MALCNQLISSSKITGPVPGLENNNFDVFFITEIFLLCLHYDNAKLFVSFRESDASV